MKKNVCLHYLPCSEDYKKQHCNSNASVHFAMPLSTVNCQLSTVNWIHTFSAKKKDTETGLSYFGSRYYSSDLSIWLSVDPMSDKYPSLSPYTYCANNPVKLVDPNGEEIWIVCSDGTSRLKYTVGMQYDGTDEKVKARIDNLNTIYNTDVGKGVVTSLVKSKQFYMIMDNDNQCSSNPNWIENNEQQGKCGGQIMLNNDNLDAFAHELFHAYQSEEGRGGKGCVLNEVEAYLFQYMVTDNCGLESLFSKDGLEGDRVRSYNYAVQAIWDTKGADSACMEEVVNGFKDISHANRNGNYSSRRLYNRKQNHTSLFSNLIMKKLIILMIVQCPLYVLGQQMDDFKHCSETWTFFSCYDVCTYDDTEPIIFFLIHLIQSTKLIMICTSTLWTQYHLTSRIVDNLYVFGTLIKTEKNQGWIDQFMNYTMLKTYLRN